MLSCSIFWTSRIMHALVEPRRGWGALELTLCVCVVPSWISLVVDAVCAKCVVGQIGKSTGRRLVDPRDATLQARIQMIRSRIESPGR